jgi:hypothetical protein
MLGGTGDSMSKLFKVLAVVGVLAGTMAATSGTALAQRHGGGAHSHGGGGGHWRGGGYRGGWGPGFGIGFGSPYYYGAPYYYGGPGNCGYSRVRLWRNGHWVLRRYWRCY